MRFTSTLALGLSSSLLVIAGCGGSDGTPDGAPIELDGGPGIDAEIGIDAAPRDGGPPQECEGTATACALAATQPDCMGVIGCGWTQCAGFAVTCEDRPTMETCDASVGCTWTGTRCDGVVTQCSAFLDAGPCADQPGCTWSTRAQCRGLARACETFPRAECTMQPGCREHVAPVDAGPRDAQIGMCSPDGGRPEGCVEPAPPIATPGCNPETGIECDGDWTGTNPRTGAAYCSPACGAEQCCVPRDGVFQCVARNEGGACPAADIYIDGSHIEGMTTLDEVMIGADSCELEEMCVGGTGLRRLLRFDTWTPNIGGADLYLGVPSTGPGSPFTPSTCHGHMHFNSYAAYELLSPDSCCVAATGHKQAFCLIDLARHDETIGGDSPAYDCGFQGIQRGWQDIYSAGLDCQFVDVTDVPPGDYVLRIRVNVEHILLEENYGNNQIDVPVTIPE